MAHIACATARMVVVADGFVRREAFMSRLLRFALALAICGLAVPSRAHDMAGHNHGGGASGPRSGACTQPIPSCARSVTPAFDKDGALRVIYSVGGRVYVAHSTDDGKTFAPAVALTSQPAEIDDNFDARPLLTIARDGTIAAIWSQFRDKNWNGLVLTSRSTDGGKTFTTPAPVTQSVSQRFASMAFAPDGALWATWLDKRNLAAAKASGDDYAGAGLAVSVSRDGGATFAPASIVSNRTCECCRVSLAFDPDGGAVAGWRQIFGKNFRDHEVGRFSPDGKGVDAVRVSEDNWAIDACPHHGPNLAIDASGTRHIVWYTGGTVRSGLFYAQAKGQGAAFSAPLAFGNAERTPSHPQVAVAGESVVIAWKEFDGERTSVMVQTSTDGGATWSSPISRSSTADASDHPILIGKDRRIYLSWLTRMEGFRVMPVGTAGER